MMEHLGELAAEAESEDEAAEHFLPLIGMAASKLLPVVAKAVAPMAKRALPKIARALTKATPQLDAGNREGREGAAPQSADAASAAGGARRSPDERWGSIAHKAARGGHVTPRTAVRTLAQQTRRVLGTPRSSGARAPPPQPSGAQVPRTRWTRLDRVRMTLGRAGAWHGATVERGCGVLPMAMAARYGSRGSRGVVGPRAAAAELVSRSGRAVGGQRSVPDLCGRAIGGLPVSRRTARVSLGR